MSRPKLHSFARTSLAVAACLAVLTVVQRLQDNDSAAATRGLVTTFSGKAFAASPSSQAPVMRIRGLREGQATSGTVTVRNRGPGTRYFWLSPGRVSERVGAGGGKLSSSMALSVLDVTDIDAPVVVYRGPLAQVGARPLGFLDAGARRSFSFVAERPAGGRSPAAPSVDPYRSAGATIAWTWHSLAGTPAPAQPLTPIRRERDARPPALAFSVPRHQRLLQGRALAITVRCNEDCATRPRASIGGQKSTLKVRQSGRGIQRRHAMSVRFSRGQAAALRSAMLGGRPAKVRLSVEAFDRSGNRRRDSHVIRLRPRG